MATHRGSCLCGEVVYEIDGPLQHTHHCHCQYCRKSHGTQCATGSLAASAGRRWLRGESSIVRYESSPGFHRWFCVRCGSPLPGDDIGGLLFVPLGNLDGDPGVRPAFHMFAKAKAPWWEIRDALPAFDGFPPGVDASDAPDLESQRISKHHGQHGSDCQYGRELEPAAPQSPAGQMGLSRRVGLAGQGCQVGRADGAR